MIDREIFQKLTDLKSQEIDAVLATIVETVGSTPRAVGAKMIICADGTTYGSIGGGCGENEVKSAALHCLLATRTPQLVEVSLLDDLGTRGGDVCGGRMLIFVELV